MIDDEDAWKHVLRVTRPALLLASPAFLDEIAERLSEAGIQDAVARHDSAPIIDWMLTLISLQGISDHAAFTFDAVNGGITADEIGAGLARSPSCPRLGSYWRFEGCGYRKGTGHCAEPGHHAGCPLPLHHLRKGVLNQAGYSLFLFVRDVCGGDLVSWIDHRLAHTDPSPGSPNRGVHMREALLGPLVNIAGLGRKIISMTLPELLLVGDPGRERWLTAGASFTAVDSLVHAHLHRTGSLRRLGAEHRYGEACYRAGGCADVLAGLAKRIDAREFNRAFPAVFPRFVQHSLWSFCAAGGWNVCNGTRIDDREACRQVFCTTSHACARVPLGR